MLKLPYHEDNITTANLYLNEGRVSKLTTLTPSVINITTSFAPERRRVEDFIKAIYKKNYNADIEVQYPILMSVRNIDNDILAAVGFRYAAKEALFLEQYTKLPIETILNAQRDEIVEIGNLASAGQGASIFLFAALSSYLHSKNIHYATVTGTDFLHEYFKKSGLKPVEICDASPSSLAGDNQNWGSYYETRPRVLAGCVKTGVSRLKAALGAEFEDCRPPLFSRLHYKDENP